MWISDKFIWRRSSVVALLFLNLCLAARNIDRRIRCDPPDMIPNGHFKLKRNGMIMRINCITGYTLEGNRVVDCINGKWYGEKGVCARGGCNTLAKSPENGVVQRYSNHKVILFCDQHYILAGNRFAYCNGTNWDREIGECRKRKNIVDLSCDFEAEDYCGWAFDVASTHHWRRVMAANIFKSYHTGPMHDHTTQNAYGGHYMLMESWGSGPREAIKLMSPVYKLQLTSEQKCCFQFYYFMYGSGVGSLFTYIKPVSVDVEEMIHSNGNYLAMNISGNQNNFWNEAHFAVTDMLTDFQIVFVATRGTSHLNDIAIDDVRLLTGDECSVLLEDKTFESDFENITAIYDTQSCEFRCGEQTGNSVVQVKGELVGLCNCHDECQVDDSCCPDFITVCFDDSTSETIDLKEDTNYSSPSYTDYYESYDSQSESIPTEQSYTVRTTDISPFRTRTSQTTTSKKPTTLKTTAVATTTTIQTTTTTVKPTTTTTTRKMKATARKSTTTTTTTRKPIKTTTVTPTTTTTTNSTTRKPTTTSTTTTTSKSSTRNTPSTTRKSTITTKTTMTANVIKVPSPTTTTASDMSVVSTSKTTTQPIIPIYQEIFPTLKNTEINIDINKLEKVVLKKECVETWDVAEEVSANNRNQQSFPEVNMLKRVLLLSVCTIALAAAVYRYKNAFIDICNNQKYSVSSGTADIESTSIIAKFSQRTRNLSGEGQINAIVSRAKQKLNRSRSEMATPLCGDDTYEHEYDDSSIALQKKTSTDL